QRRFARPGKGPRAGWEQAFAAWQVPFTSFVSLNPLPDLPCVQGREQGARRRSLQAADLAGSRPAPTGIDEPHGGEVGRIRKYSISSFLPPSLARTIS